MSFIPLFSGSSSLGGYTPPTPDYVPVFVLSGQSNAAGNANSGRVTPYNAATVPNVRIYNLNTNAWETLAINVNNRIADDGFQTGTGFFGTELSLGYHLAQLYGQEVYLIKQAKGGAWLAPQSVANTTYDPGTPGSLYYNLTDRVTAAMAALQASGKTGRIEGVFWLQGESDASNATAAAAYQANLTNFIDTFRGFIASNNYGGSSPPFVTANVMTPYANNGTVNTAINTVASTQQNVSVASISGLTQIDEAIDVHWDGASLQTLGRRLAESLSLSTSIIVANDLAVLLDAQDYASLTFNSTTVSNVENRGTAGDAVQATALNQPLYVSSAINSKPALQYRHNGSNPSILSIADSVALDYTRFTLFAVVQRVTDTGTDEMIAAKESSGTADQREFRLNFNSSDTLTARHTPFGTTTGVVVNVDTVSTATGTPIIAQLHYDGTNLVLSKNNTQVDADALAGVFNGDAAFLVGAVTAAGSLPFAGYISEVRFYTANISAVRKTRLAAYYLEKWGVP